MLGIPVHKARYMCMYMYLSVSAVYMIHICLCRHWDGSPSCMYMYVVEDKPFRL